MLDGGALVGNQWWLLLVGRDCMLDGGAPVRGRVATRSQWAPSPVEVRRVAARAGVTESGPAGRPPARHGACVRSEVAALRVYEGSTVGESLWQH
jgi:hypothetical protein